MNQNVRCFDNHVGSLRWNFTLSSISFNYKNGIKDNDMIYPEINIIESEIRAVDPLSGKQLWNYINKDKLIDIHGINENGKLFLIDSCIKHTNDKVLPITYDGNNNYQFKDYTKLTYIIFI